jgi:hypothetical protein
MKGTGHPLVMVVGKSKNPLGGFTRLVKVAVNMVSTITLIAVVANIKYAEFLYREKKDIW